MKENHYKMENSRYYLRKLIKLHEQIRCAVLEQTKRQSRKGLSEVASEGSGDVSYKIDLPAERIVDEFFELWSREIPLALVMEGIGRKTYPVGAKEKDCKAKIIIDPIDGSRPLAHDIDSAWILTGVAKGETLEDITIALQTEIPTTKQYLTDVLFAIKGQGAYLERWNLLEQKIVYKSRLLATTADSIEYGYAMLAKFSRGGKDILASLEEELFRRVLGPLKKGKADVFDHQYISNAGQLYHLITGRYRFVADIRPWLEEKLKQRGEELGLCAHPYDLCTKLIAEEAGIIITDLEGNKLNAPLDTTTNVAWIGYANEKIRRQVEPPFLDILHSS